MAEVVSELPLGHRTGPSVSPGDVKGRSKTPEYPITGAHHVPEDKTCSRVGGAKGQGTCSVRESLSAPFPTSLPWVGGSWP